MARFLIRRILQGVVVMWLVTVRVFELFFIGGGPASVAHRLPGKETTPQSIDLIRKRLLLATPLSVQYWYCLANLLHGNLDYSYIHGESVTSVIGRALPVTLSLVIGAAVIWLAIGIVPGVVSAVRRGSVWDRIANAIAPFFLLHAGIRPGVASTVRVLFRVHNPRHLLLSALLVVWG
jgi:peptide/nickel transport system permease protein